MARLFASASSEFAAAAAAVLTAYPYTFACWGRATTLAADMTMVSIGDTSVTNVFQELLLMSTGAVRVRSSNGASPQAATTAGTVGTGTWFHAAAIVAASNDRRAALNGTVSAPNTTSRTWGTGHNQTAAGTRSASSTPQYFDGDLAEVGIWNVAINGTDLAQLVYGISPRLVRPDALVFYAPLIGRASPETDWRGGNSLTLTGTAASAHPRVFYATGYRGQAVAPVTAFDPGSDAAWHGRAPVYVPRTTRILASGTTRVSREG